MRPCCAQLGSAKGFTPHDKYNILCWKWQRKTFQVFKDALQSKEYVLVRNALRVLARMIKVRHSAGCCSRQLLRAARCSCLHAACAPISQCPS